MISERLSILSPAKINFGLRIPFRLESGYHHIISIFLPVSLCDEITLQPGTGKLLATSHLPEKYHSLIKEAFAPEKLPENLMGKAIELFNATYREFYGKTSGLPVLDVHIDKRIPSPSGLGGGSSNAGAILAALSDAAPGSNEDKKDFLKLLQKKALGLGADIPFFLDPRPSLVSGVGEVIADISFPEFIGVIGVPDFGLSTSLMYRNLKKTLQSDTKFKFVLSNEYRTFAGLLESVHKVSGSLSNHFLQTVYTEGEERELLESSFRKPISFPEKGGLVENEFWSGIEKLYPQEAKVIGNARDSAAEILHRFTGRDVFRGLSGSGSAFFALSFGQFDRRLFTKLRRTLREKSPEINWYAVKSHWAVAKR